MNLRERFSAVMTYQPFDRVPIWYFGSWPQTKERWKKEGLAIEKCDRSPGPDLPGMDKDWGTGLWEHHGLANLSWIPEGPCEILEETEEHQVIRPPWGGVQRVSKTGGAFSEHVEEALLPTRESWRQFKRFVDVGDPKRVIAELDRRAEAFAKREHVLAFMGGSLYGWPRDWMGVEGWSCLAYDDPALYEEIIEHLTEYFMTLMGPVLDRVDFDLCYLFEDCCFNTGPLFSPATYKQFYHKYYVRLIEFYRKKGVPLVLLDSDGKVDDLIGCWLDSGVDILFPIEVGTWKADPVKLRRKFGKSLRMMGGFDKHLIPKGESVFRPELERLLPLVKEGGFIPFPDHRIPPDCSLEQMRNYIRVFGEVFSAKDACGC